jgi:hypothetical protein
LKPETFGKLCNTDLYKLEAEGLAILRSNEKRIKNALKCANTITAQGMTIGIANAPPDISNIICNELANKHHYGITYYDDGDIRKFSLRSKGNVNVAEIAKKYGGGGHPNAAGFQLKIIPETVLTNNQKVCCPLTTVCVPEASASGTPKRCTCTNLEQPPWCSSNGQAEKVNLLN